MTWPVLINSTDREIMAEYLTHHGLKTPSNASNEVLCTRVYLLKGKKAPTDVAARCRAVRNMIEVIKEERHKRILGRLEVRKWKPLKVSPEMQRSIDRAGEQRVYGSHGY